MLLEAGLALASELSLEVVLRRIVELAVEITGARYGALGVLGHDGRLADFITVGITDEQRHQIGDLPVGRGLLGLLIKDARPVRVADIGKDPRSVGFPANHPPMRAFLGAPVTARGRVFGNIYLTEKLGTPQFDEDDERAVVVLATQAGVAIENARLHQEAARREARLDAIREVSGAILAGSGAEEVLELVTRRARELVDGDVATVATTAGEGTLEILVADGMGAGDLLGSSFPVEGTISGAVIQGSGPQLIDDASADLRTSQPVVGHGDIGPAMFVALATPERVLGTLTIGKRRGAKPFDFDDLLLVETFGAQAAVGLEYARTRTELDRLMVMEDRERIARELHDGAIQSLFAVGMGLQGAATLTQDQDLRGRMESAVVEIDRVIRDLRNYIFGLRPGILADRQLEAAIRELAREFQERTDILVVVEIDPQVAAELASSSGDVVQLLRELLSNVGRHSGAESCRVSLSRREGRAVLEVDDDGKGFDPGAVVDGNGLANMQVRTGSLGGTLELESSLQTGTTIRIALPL
jgi:GAF domain-containing protein